MNKENFPHAITVFAMVASWFPLCSGKTELAIYVVLNAICLQLVVSNLKD